MYDHDDGDARELALLVAAPKLRVERDCNKRTKEGSSSKSLSLSLSLSLHTSSRYRTSFPIWKRGDSGCARKQHVNMQGISASHGNANLEESRARDRRKTRSNRVKISRRSVQQFENREMTPGKSRSRVYGAAALRLQLDERRRRHAVQSEAAERTETRDARLAARRHLETAHLF